MRSSGFNSWQRAIFKIPCLMDFHHKIMLSITLMIPINSTIARFQFRKMSNSWRRASLFSPRASSSRTTATARMLSTRKDWLANHRHNDHSDHAHAPENDDNYNDTSDDPSPPLPSLLCGCRSFAGWGDSQPWIKPLPCICQLSHLNRNHLN